MASILLMRPIVYPADYLFRSDPMGLGDYGRRFLAEGDSWFTIGTLNLAQASNVLFKLELNGSVVIVNCAYPGHTLQHMVDCLNDPYFDRLLRVPRFASYWEAILISGGGNDLIDAAQIPATDVQGRATPPEYRLLLTPTEVALHGAANDAASYVSSLGWQRLADYLKINIAELVKRRDEGPSAKRPIFMHTYARPTVRRSGTVGASAGWIYPAMISAGVPNTMWQPVSDLLFHRLRTLLLAFDQGSGNLLSQPQLHVFDSFALTDIIAAVPDSTGDSNDWVNEIHLTPGGYGKMGRAFGAFIDQTLAKYP